jgi:hypothetical protein
MKPHLLIGAALFLCVAWTGAQAQNNITILTPRVVFTNKTGNEQVAQMRVNFDPLIATGTQFTVCVKPNQLNGIDTACPVFKLPVPQCFLVTKPGPHKFNLTLKSNNTVTKRIMSCALTYSIVPLGQPPNYFGFPEIIVPYSLQ